MWGSTVIEMVTKQNSKSSSEDTVSEDQEQISYWEYVGKNREAHDVAALRRLHEDIQFSMDQQLSVFNELTEKGRRLFRFSGLVLTIFLAMVSQQGFDNYLNGPVKLGVFLLLISSIIGLIAQFGQSVTVGPGKKEFQTHQKGKLKEVEYLRWIISEGYIQWIDEAGRKSELKSRLIRIGYLSGILGMTSVVWGIYLSL